ncbi:substrate-binding domain-containing protein [Mycoplasma bradburyae]|uniref:substrate-binding domain-containing protein n=1 Tax=Mycoplasma bradburyae TaxID=2963128 RepID=UPI00234155CB|nr:substrate-binding domain-containing protein [Mycoplasma bradburyae]MDC4182572.1 substrate-binding domain-containing protein [Mycoplasma bradburyae]
MSSCSLNFVVINTRGSSSVQPFIDALSALYAKYEPVEISVQAGGSTSGITSVLDDTANIGNVSRSPREQVLSSKKLSKDWKEKEIKTVTLAKDAIAIIYKKPDNLDAKNFYVDANNISKIYEAFAGHNNVSLSNFYFGNNIKEDFSVIPFARSGAASVSGTAEAFLHNSGLIKDNELDKTTFETLKGLIDYGSNTITTGESNVETYNFFKTNARKVGSMTYLSLGFILNNIDAIHKDGFEVLNYKINDKVVTPTIESVRDSSYKWTRPYNIVFSLKKNNEEKLKSIKEFIKFTVFSSNYSIKEKVDEVYKSQGLIHLSDNEIKQMFLIDKSLKNKTINELLDANEDLFWTSDYSFNPIRFGVEF